jgi:hypothetical protein
MTLPEPMAISPIYDFKWPVFIALLDHWTPVALSYPTASLERAAQLQFGASLNGQTWHAPHINPGNFAVSNGLETHSYSCSRSANPPGNENDFPMRRHSPFYTAL